MYVDGIFPAKASDRASTNCTCLDANLESFCWPRDPKVRRGTQTPGLAFDAVHPNFCSEEERHGKSASGSSISPPTCSRG